LITEKILNKRVEGALDKSRDNQIRFWSGLFQDAFSVSNTDVLYSPPIWNRVSIDRTNKSEHYAKDTDCHQEGCPESKQMLIGISKWPPLLSVSHFEADEVLGPRARLEDHPGGPGFNLERCSKCNLNTDVRNF
jgi:hypothetical protein